MQVKAGGRAGGHAYLLELKFSLSPGVGIWIQTGQEEATNRRVIHGGRIGGWMVCG